MTHSERSVRTDGSFTLDMSEEQADLARLTNALRVVVEVNQRCWRGDDCELCDGVRHGVGRIAEHTQQQSDLLEQRVRPSLFFFRTGEGLNLIDTHAAAVDLGVSQGNLDQSFVGGLLTAGHQSQRDLYIAMRDLFVRHDRLASDNVERLKKRVNSNSMKLEGLKGSQKDGWQEDADRVVVLIEKDQATMASLLNRRVFIRAR